MHIRFYANMRTTVGRASLEITDGVASFRELLALLVDKYPETAFHLMDAKGNLRPDVPVYVDGRNPRLTPLGIDTPLQPDSTVSFFSPISSGKINVEVLRD
ncbi:MAG: MoaD/ThiS family protein [Anaerolineales bacterium]|nr:MoaD/ThiS family protein [Anaerolineales bacterium]